MCYTLLSMPKSGLPKAKITVNSLKIGSISIKTERPTETKVVVEKSIKAMKNAANKNIFAENEELYL